VIHWRTHWKNFSGSGRDSTSSVLSCKYFLSPQMPDLFSREGPFWEKSIVNLNYTFEYKGMGLETPAV